MLTYEDVTRYFIISGKYEEDDLTFLILDQSDKIANGDIKFLYFDSDISMYKVGNISNLLTMYVSWYIHDEMRETITLKNVCHEKLAEGIKPFVFKTEEEAEQVMIELNLSKDEYSIYGEEITELLHQYYFPKHTPHNKPKLNVLLIHSNIFTDSDEDMSDIPDPISYQRMLALKDLQRYLWYMNIEDVDNNIEEMCLPDFDDTLEMVEEKFFFKYSVGLLYEADAIYIFNDNSPSCRIFRQIAKEFNIPLINDLFEELEVKENV